MNHGFSVNQKSLDNLFCGWNREVLISWPEWDAALKISAKSPLEYLVIITPPEEDFFCVEPVSHVTDAFNLFENESIGHGAKILLPDEVLAGKISFVPVLN